MNTINSFFLVIFICSIANLTISLSLKIQNNQFKNSEALIKWGKTNGAKFDSIEIKFHNENNRYIVASKEIKKGDTVFEISDSLILTDNHPKIQPFCKEYGLKEENCLATFICAESKKKDNFFQPYFEFLPNDLSNFPLFFNNNLKTLMKGSQISQLTEETKKTIEEEYKKLKVKIYFKIIDEKCNL